MSTDLPYFPFFYLLFASSSCFIHIWAVPHAALLNEHTAPSCPHKLHKLSLYSCFNITPINFPLSSSVDQYVSLYKVVQIWPGRFVCKQVTVCPGHIWTTLYYYMHWDQSVTKKFHKVDRGPSIRRSHLCVKNRQHKYYCHPVTEVCLLLLSPLSCSGRTFISSCGQSAAEVGRF
jgi:hypothetical protein